MNIVHLTLNKYIFIKLSTLKKGQKVFFEKLQFKLKQNIFEVVKNILRNLKPNFQERTCIFKNLKFE